MWKAGPEDVSVLEIWVPPGTENDASEEVQKGPYMLRAPDIRLHLRPRPGCQGR